MRIEKVTINNFRNYLGTHEFDFSRDITIFYGDNGFGKSSFFDALEWCISGTVSRFSDEGESERLKKDIVNRYTLTNNERETIECSVCIEFNGTKLIRKFSVNDGAYGNVLVRITDKENNTLKNHQGKSISGKDRVEEYLSGTFSKKQGSSKNIFGKLMKQTYILSQDQVTDFITSQDPGETFRSIASIMGFKPLLNLSDNMKKVHVGLKSSYRSLEEELEKKRSSIESKEETKQEVDMYKLNNKLDLLKLNPSENILESGHKLDELRDRAAVNKKEYKDLLKLIESLESDFNNIGEVEHSINFVEKKRENLNLKINSYISLKDRIDNLVKQLNQDKLDYIENKKKSIAIQEMNQELETYKLSSTDILFFKADIEKKEELNLKYRYVLLNSEDYRKYRNSITSLPKRRKEQENKLDYFSKMHSNRIRLLRRINDKLVESENGAVINLVNNIKEIHKYLQHTNHNETCPVCSSVKPEGLLPIVEGNLEEYGRNITHTSRYVEKLLLIKNKVSSSLKNIEGKIRERHDKLSSFDSLLEVSQSNLKRLEEDSLFDAELMKEDTHFIDERISLNTVEIGKLNRIIKLLFELEKLTNGKEVFKKQGSILSEQDITKRLRNLTRAEQRINSRILNLKDEDNESTVKQSQSNKLNFLKKIKNLKFDNHHSFDQIKGIMIQKLKGIEDTLKNISEIQSVYSVIKQNSYIEEQIVNIRGEEKSLDLRAKNLLKIIENLSKYIDTMFGDFGINAKDYLNSYSSPIQKYFRYLNPLPTRSTVKFEGENSDLFVKVIFDENENDADITSPKNILSSGQLNVLAISIFLAMNDSQKIHKLDFMAIDDPIQNMDDVNQFSICDVLGSIKKQLIFSTHDFDFLKLFIKKNEYKKHNIQVYNFKSPFLLPEKVEHIVF